jgi:hypothetical protein
MENSPPGIHIIPGGVLEGAAVLFGILGPKETSLDAGAGGTVELFATTGVVAYAAKLRMFLQG